jgi:hypothetical protein
MIKKLIIFFFVIFIFNFISSQDAKAQSTVTFCSTAEWGTDDCVSLCSDLNITSLASDVGFCHGKTTKYQMTIQRIDLGTSEGFNGYKCTIFEGTIITDSATASAGKTISNKPLKYKHCKETTYDRVYMYADRKVLIAGNTIYPGSSPPKIARTTSACKTDSTSTVSNLNWLDLKQTANPTTNWNDPNLCLGRYTTGMNTHVIKTEKATFSTTDYSSLSNETNEWDDFKSLYLTSLETANSDGFYLDAGSTILGAKLNNANQIIYFLGKDSSNTIIKGLDKPFDKKKQLKFEINYIALERGKDFGLRFWFLNAGGVAKLMGVSPGENGLYLTISQF